MTHSRNSFKMVFADYQERNTTMSHYHHLSTIERESILRMKGEGKSLRAMGRVLGRSASTISRELRRNGGKGKNYSPSEAERRYDRRRKRCHKKTVFSDSAAKALVQHLFLDEQWSPEQIAKSPENREQSYPGEFLNDISRNLLWRS